MYVFQLLLGCGREKANVYCSEYEGFDPVGWQSGSAPWALAPNLDWLAAQIAVGRKYPVFMYLTGTPHARKVAQLGTP